MKEFLALLDWKAFGAGAVVTLYAVYRSHLDRLDAKEEREYSRQQFEMIHQVVLKLSDTMGKLKQVVRDLKK